MSNEPIRVLVVEDSPSQRALLVGLLRTSGSFHVVGTATNGREAVEETARLRPQIVAMDIHLPVFDGYEATRRIMQHSPTPIVMVSSSSGNDERRALDALAAGALAVVRKPGALDRPESAAERDTLLRTLRLMAGVRVVTRHAPRQPRSLPQLSVARPIEVVAVAASTGGPAALQAMLSGLGSNVPVPVLVVQHIARGFTEALIDWMSGVIPQPLSLVHESTALTPGRVYFAADDRHLVVQGRGRVTVRLPTAGDRYCPSADLLFSGVAQHYGAAAAGVIMTGMGDDGAQGLAQLREAGGPTFGQDETTCVVYGMPHAARVIGAVVHELPLQRIGPAVRNLLNTNPHTG